VERRLGKHDSAAATKLAHHKRRAFADDPLNSYSMLSPIRPLLWRRCFDCFQKSDIFPPKVATVPARMQAGRDVADSRRRAFLVFRLEQVKQVCAGRAFACKERLVIIGTRRHSLPASRRRRGLVEPKGCRWPRAGPPVARTALGCRRRARAEKVCHAVERVGQRIALGKNRLVERRAGIALWRMLSLTLFALFNS